MTEAILVNLHHWLCDSVSRELSGLNTRSFTQDYAVCSTEAKLNAVKSIAGTEGRCPHFNACQNRSLCPCIPGFLQLKGRTRRTALREWTDHILRVQLCLNRLMRKHKKSPQRAERIGNFSWHFHKKLIIN